MPTNLEQILIESVPQRKSPRQILDEKAEECRNKMDQEERKDIVMN